MSELKQIATVLRSMGITIENIEFDTWDEDNLALTFKLSYKGQRIIKSYTIEQIRSELITEPTTQPAGPQRLDRIAKGVMNHIKPE